jgi:phosphate transport system substrate-binding protein
MAMLSRRTLSLSILVAPASLILSRMTRASVEAGARIVGVGTSFPALLIQKWAQDYYAQTGIAVNYQTLGSAAAIQQVIKGTVDFGASTIPLSAADLASKGLIQIPFVLGGVVPVVNLPGFPASNPLKLTGKVLAGLFLGQIQAWDDDRIRAANPGRQLPGLAVVPVHYAEGSGTTFVFTSYLAAADPVWAARVGIAAMPPWPAGIASRGNGGVAQLVGQTPGAIGFMEASFASASGCAGVSLLNRDNAWVSPTPEAFKAAATHAVWSPAQDFQVMLVDEPGRESWPIVATSYFLLRKDRFEQPATLAVRRFVRWSITSDAPQIDALGYIPLPRFVTVTLEGILSK